MAKQPAPLARIDRNFTKPVSRDIRHAVMPCQPLVDERVVGIEKLENAPILAGEDTPYARRAFADPRAYLSQVVTSSLHPYWMRSSLRARDASPRATVIK